MKHEYSIEVLYHFNCSVCSNWWSYATTPSYINNISLSLPDYIDYYCPHCGADEKVTVKRGIFSEKT